eukprot:evm.model.scf_329EXC.2 EVM.evm.TU.scf_329EXC.2   scf_329EXC:17023-24592(+)
MSDKMDLSLSGLATAYASGQTPSSLITKLYPRLEDAGATLVTLAPLERLLQRCGELEAIPAEDRGPLWGAPYVVKDNIDVAGLPTTAACRAFKYTPDKNAPCVQALEDAGALAVGKANMDQFAAGLVGTRSDYGVARNAFDKRFIPGGSSSGSAAAVGAGIVSFALGTDTAGSGRVPAMFNGCVGVKPTVGRVSTVGVVPACRSLDCVSIFCQNVEDGVVALKAVEKGESGPADPTKRLPASEGPPSKPPSMRFGVPAASYLSFCGPGGLHVEQQLDGLFAEAVGRLEKLGYQKVEIDYAPFAAVASLLYGGAFVAERISGIREFLQKGQKVSLAVEDVANDERLLPVTRAIISGGARFSATDLFDDMAKLAVHQALARSELSQVDFLVVPTAPAHYTIKEIMDEEGVSPPTWSQNANLGRFTNFVNLMDMCGVAVPSGSYAGGGGQNDSGSGRGKYLRESGDPNPTLPFGITLLAPAWSDEWLSGIAAKFQKATGLGCGPKGHGLGA